MPVVPASVESTFAFDQIKQLFVHELQGDSSGQSKKAVWHNLCLTKAGVEEVNEEKMHLEALQTKLRLNYDRWAKLIVKEDPSSGVSGLAEYVTENMFMTTDIGGLKVRANNPMINEALWKQWNAAKSAIVNFDNLAATTVE